MRFAVFGDVHGNLAALEAVLADLSAQRPDGAVCLGDLAFRGPQPAECVRRVRALGVPCVHGNTDLMLLAAAGGAAARHVPDACRARPVMLPFLGWHVDRLAAADLEYLAALPSAHRVGADGVRVLFVHATPGDCVSTILPLQREEDLRVHLEAADADVLVMGHVHRAFAFRHGGVLLVNAGAVGFSLDGDWRPAYAVLDTVHGSVELRRVAYDVERALAAARESGFPVPVEEYEQALRSGWWGPIDWERCGRATAGRGPVAPGF